MNETTSKACPFCGNVLNHTFDAFNEHMNDISALKTFVNFLPDSPEQQDILELVNKIRAFNEPTWTVFQQTHKHVLSGKQEYNLFVQSWSDTHVTCYIVEEGIGRKRRFVDERLFNGRKLFDGFKLFKGKQIRLYTTIVPGTFTISVEEVKTTRLRQIVNYWMYVTWTIRSL